MNNSAEILAGLIGRIYEAAYEPEYWPSVVVSIRDAFHGSKACLGLLEAPLSTSDVIAPDADPVWTEIYIEHFLRNELSNSVSKAPVGIVHNDHTLLGRDTMRRTRFWNEWMAPQDMYGSLVCKLNGRDGNFSFFDIQRGKHQSGFDDADATLFRALVPHLQRADKINRELGGLRSLSRAFQQLPFGALLVSGTMDILVANAAADLIFSERESGLSSVQGKLAAKSISVANQLEKMVATVCTFQDGVAPGGGGSLLVGSETGEPQLILSISAMISPEIYGTSARSCALLLLRRPNVQTPQVFQDYMCRSLSLTRKEAAIAYSLAAGATLKETADIENITFGTARTHLEKIFAKTGTRQQSQLVALLKNLQPLG
jgi:DNA-binding CsgD family transcriptional regulator